MYVDARCSESVPFSATEPSEEAQSSLRSSVVNMAWLLDIDYLGIILDEVKKNALYPLGLKDTYFTDVLSMFLTEFILGAVTAFAVPALDYVTFYAQLIMKRNNNIYKINQPVDEGT